MKKILYIGIAVVALGLSSCSKQDVQPNTNSDVVVPVWKSLSNDDNINSTSGGTNTGTITDPELEGDGGSTITDPELQN